MKIKTRQKHHCLSKITRKGFALILFIFFLFLPSVALAEETESDPLGFTVEPITPATQINQNRSFYYIKTEPNQPQELKAKLTGTSEEPVQVKVYVSNATTSEDATINYVPDLGKDETLSSSVEEITEVSSEVIELAKGETKEVAINVTPPTENYSGIKLGAVYFERVMDEETTDSVTSKLSYRVGLVTSEATENYKNGESLNLLDAQPDLLKKQKTIALTLQNPDAQVIDDFSMDIKIYDKNSGEVVKTQRMANGSIAPNTHFTYPVDWGIDPIPSGDYLVKIHAESDKHEWDLEKEFTITEEKAKEMNEETAFKLTLPTWFYITTIASGVVTILGVIYLLYRGKKWEELYLARVKKSKKKN